LQSDRLFTGTDGLVEAASAGAIGAKLSGGGRGGNMIALVEPEKAETISLSLKKLVQEYDHCAVL
jgi:mevalonate kinase